MSNLLIYVDNAKYIDDYRKVGVSAFLFALEGYSIGYNTYSVEEINNIDVSNKYVLLNRLLDSDSIDNLRSILLSFKDIKGIVFEDIGVYELVRELKIEVEMILFQNHFNTNVNSINYYLSLVDSVFVSNELTYEEILNITQEVNGSICLHLYGYNQVMYSRRKLLSNWSKEFKIPYEDKNVIEDVSSHVRFRAFENDYGTVMYSDKIFNGKKLLDLDNVKFFYVNTIMISHDVMMDFLSNMDNHDSEMEDNGFLDRETIYKLKER